MLGLGKPVSAARTLRALAALLGYPDARLRAHLPEVRQALRDEGALGADRLAEIEALIDALGGGDPFEVEANYVELFDRSRNTALHLFEHVHGESRERGPAMIDLAQTYAQAGLYLAPGELPDYLPVVLEFASTRPAREARAFLGEIAHLLNKLFGALRQRGSAYAGVMGALLELAGETAQPVAPADEPPLDESWSEPPVFDGCSTRGQAGPGQPQPVRILRRNDQTGAAA